MGGWSRHFLGEIEENHEQRESGLKWIQCYRYVNLRALPVLSALNIKPSD